MQIERVETVVVGGGQAGLAVSHHLGQLGCEHLVIERDRVAERWRSERWDSLHFQAPNWNLRLPGLEFHTPDPNAFAAKDDIVRFIESYASHIQAPTRCGVAAIKLRQKPGSTRLVLETSAGQIEAMNVIVATGPYQYPADHIEILGGVHQVHSSQYRNPNLLPPGAVLVIGTGNSGCQIAEELCSDGRRVYLSVSVHQRTPRRYRGKDFIWWNLTLGDADVTVEQRRAGLGSRLMTGVGGGHDLDLRQLAADGVVLIGRVLCSNGGRLAIADDLAGNLARGDASLDALIRRCDAYAERNGLDLPTCGTPPIFLPDPREVTEPIRSLDLADAGIAAIVWANGSICDFSWIDLPVFADMTAPKRLPQHTRGVTSVPGLYFLGLPWLHKWKSAFLFGVGEDAAYIAHQIAGCSRGQ